MPVLTGARVRLRPFDVADVDELFRGVTDPELRRLTGTHHEFTRDEVLAYATSRERQTDRYDWVVCAPDGDVLGDVSLNSIDTDNGTSGFRIALHRGEGHGRGTEATRLVLEFAFDALGLYRVELEVFDFNARARATYAKCGFEVEGVRRGGLRWAGVRHDVIMMAAVDPTPGR